MVKFVVHLYVGSQFIGFLESYHKTKNSFTVCNNKHFARYFTSENSCKSVMATLKKSYHYIDYVIVKAC